MLTDLMISTHRVKFVSITIPFYNHGSGFYLTMFNLAFLIFTIFVASCGYNYLAQALPSGVLLHLK